MAASPLSPQSHIHSCSNSLPSKPHPLILQCNEHLCRLESSAANTSFSSSSSSSFRQKLSGLQDLHDCVEKLVQLPLTQEVLVQENWVEELLDGSLRLLDVCTAAKDSLLHTKECAREVQSIMRRKRAGEMEVTVEVRKYLTSRKVVKKAILKALGNLKGASNRCKFLSPTNKCHQTAEVIKLLKDVEVVSISILESLLKFISGPTESKSSGNWSLISKLMHKKKVACTQETEEANEFSKVDAALQCFVFQAASKSDNINHLQNQLEDLQSVIQDFVEVLETLFRRFIKIRVAILNILNH